MKKIRMTALVICFLLIGDWAFSQVKEGMVIYDITYPDTDFDKDVMKMLPSESSTFFKDDKMRIDMKVGTSMNNSIIVDNSKKEVHVLMDMMGNKMDMAMTEKDVEKDIKNEGAYTISKIDETKKIAGYICNKALINTKDGQEFSVWYTKDILVKNANWNNQFRGLEGFLMEFRMNQNGLTMEMTAREIRTEKVSDDIFKIPSGYKSVSKNDLEKMMPSK